MEGGFHSKSHDTWPHSFFPLHRSVVLVPLQKKQPQSMMFPPPCFTVGMVFFGCNFLLQTRQVEFLPKSSILVSSDHMTFSQSSSGSSKCSLANFRRAWTCTGLSRGTRLALQDLSPWRRSVLLMVAFVWNKMAPRMAAVLRAPGKLCSFSYVLLVFLLFYVLDVVSITVYDRDTLLNIGSSVAQRKPDFEFLNAGGLFTDTAAEPFVWVAKSTRRRRRRKRGIRAGVLVRLRRRAFRTPLPTILLANVQSLDNKLCELRARISYQRETRDCCVICLTETWMSAMVPDSAIELTGFSVHRSDRTKELTGKSRGGGVCFYINNSWCNERNIHSIKSFCSPDLEFHTLLCRPFWLPREFTAIIITAVYIPPQANTDQALKELYRNISEQETVHPDAAFIITGDFNKANFRTIAPKYFQHVTINTRGSTQPRTWTT